MLAKLMLRVFWTLGRCRLAGDVQDTLALPTVLIPSVWRKGIFLIWKSGRGLAKAVQILSV